MMMTMTIAELKARASVAPYLGKCDDLLIREILVIGNHVTARPTYYPSAPQAYQCKITQSTGMATQMQLEVILAGNRMATRVLTTRESIKTKTKNGNCLCIRVV